MMLTISRKPVILYPMVLFGVLVLAFVIVTALQSLHSPTSYDCHASDPHKQLRSYRHKLDINVTAHTPFLTALNQASTLDTLRQHQLFSHSSLDQLNSYLISKLAPSACMIPAKPARSSPQFGQPTLSPSTHNTTSPPCKPSTMTLHPNTAASKLQPLNPTARPQPWQRNVSSSRRNRLGIGRFHILLRRMG